MPETIRRSAQALDEAEALDILRRASYGILALIQADGSPYSVPLNFVLHGKNLYFHCAQQGRKLDCLWHDSRVCVSVVEKSTVVPHIFSTDYRSVTARGRACIVTDEAEKRRALEQLVAKFCPQHIAEGAGEIEAGLAKTCIVKITLTDVTGKQASQKTREAAALPL